jgi:hypothetical protein
LKQSKRGPLALFLTVFDWLRKLFQAFLCNAVVVHNANEPRRNYKKASCFLQMKSLFYPKGGCARAVSNAQIAYKADDRLVFFNVWQVPPLDEESTLAKRRCW